MRIGICGAHRVGKTTLCEVVSKQLGINFIKTDVSAVFSYYNVKWDSWMSAEYRLDIQNCILKTCEKKWSGDNFITDRTPADFLGYSLSKISSKDLYKYYLDCFEIMNNNFDVIIKINPGINIVLDKENMQSQAHINYLINSFVDYGFYRHVRYFEIDFIDMEKRVQFVKEVMNVG